MNQRERDTFAEDRAEGARCDESVAHPRLAAPTDQMGADRQWNVALDGQADQLEPSAIVMKRQHQRSLSNEVSLTAHDMIPADVERCGRAVGIGTDVEIAFFKAQQVPGVDADRLQVVRLIDWGDNPERLIHGDFSGLHPEVQQVINELSGEDQLRRLSDQYEMPSEIVAIALLAHFASDEDPRAGRIWSAIFKRLSENLANGMTSTSMQLLEFFFGEIDGRLNELVGELARSIDGNVERDTIYIAKKTQSKCQDIMREHRDEARHRLEDLVKARIADAKKEFLDASRILRNW